MITGAQRAYLRKLANPIKASQQIGKGGVNDGLVRQLDESLEIHELLKISVLETALLSPKECAAALADPLHAEVVQCIGSKLVLYRPASDPEKRKIVLPK